VKKHLLIASVLALFGAVGLLNLAMHTSTDAHAALARPLNGSETKDWASLADGAGASEDVVTKGAVLGDFCIASMSVDVADMLLTCNVTAAGVSTVRMQNETTGTVDLASGTLRVQVIKSPQF
jgi:hypothetical protein